MLFVSTIVKFCKTMVKLCGHRQNRSLYGVYAQYTHNTSHVMVKTFKHTPP